MVGVGVRFWVRVGWGQGYVLAWASRGWAGGQWRWRGRGRWNGGRTGAGAARAWSVGRADGLWRLRASGCVCLVCWSTGVLVYWAVLQRGWGGGRRTRLQGLGALRRRPPAAVPSRLAWRARRRQPLRRTAPRAAAPAQPPAQVWGCDVVNNQVRSVRCEQSGAISQV